MPAKHDAMPNLSLIALGVFAAVWTAIGIEFTVRAAEDFANLMEAAFASRSDLYNSGAVLTTLGATILTFALLLRVKRALQ